MNSCIANTKRKQWIRVSLLHDLPLSFIGNMLMGPRLRIDDTSRIFRMMLLSSRSDTDRRAGVSSRCKNKKHCQRLLVAENLT